MLTRNEREELKALSLELFGVSSKYQKLVQGVPELVTEEIDETVPGENGAEATVRKVHVVKLTADGRRQVQTKFYTYEEVKDLMLGMKAKREEALAAQITAYEAQIAKQIEEKSVSDASKALSGSAV